MDRLDRDARVTLIDARDADPLPAAHEAAAWVRLQAAIAAGDEPRTADAPPPRADRPHARAWKLAALLAAAVLLLLAGLDRIVGQRTTDQAADQAIDQAAPAAVHDADVRSPAPATTSPSGHVPEDSIGPAATASRPVTRPSKAPADDADIVAELALLRRAREALNAGRADEALALLAEHARRFTGGSLVEERARLEVRALCAAGDRPAAQARAEAFVRAYPDSPHARKIVRECDAP